LPAEGTGAIILLVAVASCVAVAQGTLDPLAQVRILARQPRHRYRPSSGPEGQVPGLFSGQWPV
jgi:hypothetical protein